MDIFSNFKNRDHKLDFIKMSASGNDFIIIEDYRIKKLPNFQEIIKNLSDRRFGVGCDQFVLLNCSDKNSNDVEVYNQDGSRASMCINMLRCLGGLFFDNKIASSECVFNVLNEAGEKKIVKCEKSNQGFIKVFLEQYDYIKKPDHDVVIIGNKHKIIFTKLDSFIDEKPDKEFNISYVSVLKGSSLFVQTVERGVGPTLCCGSGIFASLISSAKRKYIEYNKDILIKTKGCRHNDIIGNVSIDSVALQGDYLYCCKGFVFI